jgi:hypothetical protein
MNMEGEFRIWKQYPLRRDKDATPRIVQGRVKMAGVKRW